MRHETLAIVNAAIIVFTGYWSYRGFKDDWFREKYIFSPAEILRDKQYYRLITSGFLHANWVHFIFNMYSMYSFGSVIERIFGVPTFLAIYFSSILGGNLLSLYLHRYHEYRALGASGGVCGVIFAAIFLLPGTDVMLFLIPIPIPAPVFAVLFILVSYYGLRRQVGNIGHDAHLGGALIGLAVTAVLYPASISRSPALFSIVAGLTIMLLIYTYKRPLALPAANPFTRRHRQEAKRSREKRREEKDRILQEERIDRLLEKISQSGMDSLTESEEKQLREISRKKRAAERKKKT